MHRLNRLDEDIFKIPFYDNDPKPFESGMYCFSISIITELPS